MDSRLAADIARELDNVGWELAYERLLINAGIDPNVSNVSGKGEIRCNCPFAFSSDTDRSCSINIHTGLWALYRGSDRLICNMNGGNIVQFQAFINATFNELTNAWHWDFNEAERDLRTLFNITSTPNVEWYNSCMNLITDSRARAVWANRKPWDISTLIILGVGYDTGSGRIIIPLKERSGKLVAYRMYDGRQQPKIRWGNNQNTGNIVLPNTVYQEDDLILVEGEADVLSLRSYGFNACSGTLGCGQPVPTGYWYINKTVYVMMDVDPPGEKAAVDSIKLLSGAKKISICKIPEWIDRPHNADISDYIMYLVECEKTVDEIKDEIKNILETSVSAQEVLDRDVVPPTRVDINNALTADYIGSPLVTQALVVTKFATTYAAPQRIHITCPAGGHPYCSRCPMQERNGEMTGRLNLEDPSLGINLTRISTLELTQNIKVQVQIPERCPSAQINIIGYKDVEMVQLASPSSGIFYKEDGMGMPVRLEAMLIKGENNIEPGGVYDFNLQPVPLPKTQGMIMYGTAGKRVDNTHHNFQMTREIIEEMEISFPARDGFQEVMSGLYDYADDLAQSVTFIYDRSDLHIAYLLTWFSQLSFSINDILYRRGWVELFIVGDTACGKTQTFKRLSEWYGSGFYTDKKHATAAGLLGAVETSLITGERYVTPGIMPRNDGLGPILFDEFGLSQFDQNPILAMLSGPRSEGITTITKAASANFQSRCRLVIACNPNDGALLANMAAKGVDIFKRFCPQVEDRRRFDIAIAVSQSDVNQKLLETPQKRHEPSIRREMHIALLNWGRSRGHRIKFTEEAVTAIAKGVTSMCQKYDSDMGIVEPSDQKIRIAKIAVSIATISFSHDEDAENLIVDAPHVAAAIVIMCSLFDGRWFGYDKYSEMVSSNRQIVDEMEIRKIINNSIEQTSIELWLGRIRVMTLLHISVFNTITPIHHLGLTSMFQALVLNNCLEPTDKPNQYRQTPSFQKLISAMTTELRAGERIWTQEKSDEYYQGRYTNASR